MLTTLIAAVAVAGSGVPAASASGTTLAGLSDFKYMAIDRTAGHVFVDGGNGGSVIDVMNEDGTPAGSITGETLADGMVVDGSTLYVARCIGFGQIDEVDTTSLTVVGSIPAALGGTCDLAEAGGRLWMTDPEHNELASLSTDSSHTYVDSDVSTQDAYLAPVPGHANWLVVGDTDQSPGRVSLYDVSNPASPTLLAAANLQDDGELFSMTVAADGSSLAVGTGVGVQQLSLPDLTSIGLYPMQDAASSVAISPDGSQIAAGTAIGFDGIAGYLFDTGDATPRKTWQVSAGPDTVYANGMTFDDSGSNMLEFSRGSSGSAVVMNVIPASAPAHVPTVTGYSDMVVDPAGGRVFVAGGPASSGIDVFNPDGSLDTVIDGESGAGGMVIDGGFLYVARCGWSTIDVIDTDTLTRVGSMSAPVGGNCNLGDADGRLWFSDATDDQLGHMESVAIAAPHTVIDAGFVVYPPVFADTPVHPDWLVFGEAGLDPASVAVEDVSDPSAPSMIATNTLAANAGYLRDLAVNSAGTTLLTASNTPSDIQAYTLPGLTLSHSYPIASYPDAVAASPSSGQVAGGSESGSGADVSLFAGGAASALTSWSFSPSSELTYARGVAFSPDGQHLYAVTAGASDAGPVLHVLSTVVLPKGKVSITHSLATVGYGKADTLTAHLGTSTASRSLQVWRTPVGGSPVLVHTGTAGAKGNISLVVHPAVDSTYTVKWAGDSGHAAATASVRVNVRLAMHAVTHGGYRTLDGVRLYHYTAACTSARHTGCPMFLAWAGPSQPGRSITFVAQGQTASGHWVTIAHGSAKTGTGGKLLLTIFYTSRALENVPQRIRFTMATDSANLGATSAWVHYRVPA
jgi:sugar lactone lactonase YvrE